MRWICLLLCLPLLLAGCSTMSKPGNQSETHYMLGLSFLQEQSPTLALKEFLRAEELDSRNPDIQAALGQTYQLKRAFPEAEKHYLRALKLGSSDPQVQNNLAALYLDMQRWDDAIRYFRLAGGNLLFPQQEVALTGLGMAYFQKGSIPEAVTAYREALAHAPRYLQARLLLGEAYLALGNTDQAIEEFRRAVEINPDLARPHYQLGLAHMRQSNNEKARAAFRNVLRLAPDTEYARKAAEYLNLLN